MVATLSRKELISQVREKGWEIKRGEKPKPPPVSPEVKNEKLVKSVVNAIENTDKSLSQKIMLLVNIVAEVGKKQAEPKTEVKIEPKQIEKKRKWNMDVVRDDEGLIKSIVAEEI